VTPGHVLVLKNARAVATGMPEWGMLPIPPFLGSKTSGADRRSAAGLFSRVEKCASRRFA
jgi:hypothetical protein